VNHTLAALGASALMTLGTFVGCGGSSPDTLEVLTGSNQMEWSIASRVENGGPPSLPTCAKDDTLTFTKDGTFDSLIAGTKCNPSEADVRGGTFALSSDKKVVTFTTPGFTYTGALNEVSADRLVITFDLGPGFQIQDTLTPRG
jgi:Lipocalin-like domain